MRIMKEDMRQLQNETIKGQSSIAVESNIQKLWKLPKQIETYMWNKVVFMRSQSKIKHQREGEMSFDQDKILIASWVKFLIMDIGIEAI